MLIVAPRTRAGALVVLGALAVMLVAALLIDPAFAQGNPFGAPRAAAPPDGIVGWLLAKQSEFYRGLSAQIRAAKTDGSAVWTLVRACPLRMASSMPPVPVTARR